MARVDRLLLREAQAGRRVRRRFQDRAYRGLERNFLVGKKQIKETTERTRGYHEPIRLDNKLSKKAHFELGEGPVFDLVPESAIVPLSMILEDRIGSEMVLLLIDKTPFIYTLAKVRPFDLMLKTGMVQTAHGPVAFLLFYVPNPANSDDPYFSYDHHLNPFNPAMVATLRDLARQSHWHLILVDADQKVQDVLEFGNVYGLGEALDAMTNAVSELQPGDFNLAKQEFCEQYPLTVLLQT